MADNTTDELPSLFWDTLPDDVENHPDYLALKALDEESSPEERAATLKEHGNDKLKLGLKSKRKLYLGEAVELYSRGLALKCSDQQLNATLLCNRAQAALLLGNSRKALDDCRKAVILDGSNIKAYFRAAKAASNLEDWTTAIQMCRQGLSVEKAPELEALLQEAEKKQLEKEEAERRRLHREDQYRAKALTLAAAMKGRGYRLTARQLTSTAGSALPLLDESSIMHWPVVFLYPEVMERDVVQEFCELDCFSDHLDVMFDPAAEPLVWDEQHHYMRANLVLYYLTNMGRPLSQEEVVDQLMDVQRSTVPSGVSGDDDEFAPEKYGDRAARWKQLDPGMTLQQVLSSPDYVIPGVPLFFVLAKGTPYYKRFIKCVQ